MPSAAATTFILLIAFAAGVAGLLRWRPARARLQRAECRSCGYAVSDDAAPRCSECGTVFADAPARPVGAVPESRQRLLLASWTITLLLPAWLAWTVVPTWFDPPVNPGSAYVEFSRSDRIARYVAIAPADITEDTIGAAAGRRAADLDGRITIRLADGSEHHVVVEPGGRSHRFSTDAEDDEKRPGLVTGADLAAWITGLGVNPDVDDDGAMIREELDRVANNLASVMFLSSSRGPFRLQLIASREMTPEHPEPTSAHLLPPSVFDPRPTVRRTMVLAMIGVWITGVMLLLHATTRRDRPEVIRDT